jgi:glucans biosynthesis protein
MKRKNDPMNPVHRIGDPPRCGASNRKGEPCRAPSMKGKTRCRLHGGKSLSGEIHPNYRHGLFTREAFMERRLLRRLLKECRDLI